ncbi:MAG: type II toxin-antitoxin system HicA family toxin [Candidatus Levyibacteriota bacterium]|jgi:predicted RNA binding protein YcfA (HicA-like mRNA interferase family)
MPNLTPLNWKEFEKFLLYVGCEFKRQRGDHKVYWRSGLKRPIILPTYKNLPIFIIRNNLRTLGITVEEYLEILKKI